MRRHVAEPVPAPLDAYCQRFDDVFRTVNQRASFRCYLAGVLLPDERNKTLTALANAEPIVGAHQPGVQRLQWFLSESSWQPAVLNRRRLDLLRAEPRTAPDAHGALVIDEHGDRKWGTQTAHVGRQYVGCIGKVENAVVSVTSLWADERVSWPIDVEPATPAHHFARGKADAAFRTKPEIALELVRHAVTVGLPFRAVVADSFYGENEGFTAGLRDLKVGYVVARKPSHSWWAAADTVGALWEAAEQAGWRDPAHPGAWVRVERRFRDAHVEVWWALEVEAGPDGPTKALRAVVATTDPATLPEHTTWYLQTTLPAPTTEVTAVSALPAADLAEIVRLYGLRNWVEQSYRQVKHRLGWGQYQVRSDLAIRRHWALVCCAFSFCWLADGIPLAVGDPPPQVAQHDQEPPTAGDAAGRGKNAPHPDLARGAAAGTRLADPLDLAATLVAGVVQRAPAARTARPARRARRRLPAAGL